MGLIDRAFGSHNVLGVQLTNANVRVFVCSHDNDQIVLATGTALNLVSYLPLGIWAKVLPRTCPFVVLSWLDFLNLWLGVALVLFFVFLRLEFLRSREAVIWTTVSQIQDQFDSRLR